MAAQPITKDSTNLLIHSDNIKAMRTLTEHLGSVIQCLIIDPEKPKSKSRDAFDQFAQDLDECLRLGARLLSDTGSVFIHADESVYFTYQLWTIDGRLVQEGLINSSITRFVKPQSGLYLVQLKGDTANKTIKTFLK